jgi:outer membrane protein assembly factor BamA
MIFVRILYLFFIFICSSNLLFAHTSDSTLTTHSHVWVKIADIQISGLNKTKPQIVMREIGIQIGDSILSSSIIDMTEYIKNRIFNTGLFLEVNCYTDFTTSHAINFRIELKERWFTYVFPIIGLADRNFNEWWVERNHQLNRIEWGAYFLQKNMRGRNESFKLRVELGFVKKCELFYSIPYLDKKKRFGINYAIGWLYNKQIAYQTIDNKLSYFEDESTYKFMRKRFNTSLELIYRNKFYTTHAIKIEYQKNQIEDTIESLNRHYFAPDKTLQEFIGFTYTFKRDKRNVQYYPTHGTLYMIELYQLGQPKNPTINISGIKTTIAYYKPLSNKFFFNTLLKGKISSKSQPYYNQRGLGYRDELVRGYEYYVVDGQFYFLQKNTLRFLLFNSQFKFLPVKDKRFHHVPLACYLKTYMDWGYVWDYSRNIGNSDLANAYLSGGGIGVDFVSYYDIVCRIEYSINKRLESGIFLHLNASF